MAAHLPLQAAAPPEPVLLCEAVLQAAGGGQLPRVPQNPNVLAVSLTWPSGPLRGLPAEGDPAAAGPHDSHNMMWVPSFGSS